MRLVIIESPFIIGGAARNLRYLRACMRDCLLRGEAPYAPHALYMPLLFGVLNGELPADRELGVDVDFAWREVADATVVYTNLGITPGMHIGIADAAKANYVEEGGIHATEYRKLGPDWEIAADRGIS